MTIRLFRKEPAVTKCKACKHAELCDSVCRSGYLAVRPLVVCPMQWMAMDRS